MANLHEKKMPRKRRDFTKTQFLFVDGEPTNLDTDRGTLMLPHIEARIKLREQQISDFEKGIAECERNRNDWLKNPYPENVAMALRISVRIEVYQQQIMLLKRDNEVESAW